MSPFTALILSNYIRDPYIYKLPIPYLPMEVSVEDLMIGFLSSFWLGCVSAGRPLAFNQLRSTMYKLNDSQLFHSNMPEKQLAQIINLETDATRLEPSDIVRSHFSNDLQAGCLHAVVVISLHLQADSQLTAWDSKSALESLKFNVQIFNFG